MKAMVFTVFVLACCVCSLVSYNMGVEAGEHNAKVKLVNCTFELNKYKSKE